MYTSPSPTVDYSVLARLRLANLIAWWVTLAATVATAIAYAVWFASDRYDSAARVTTWVTLVVVLAAWLVSRWSAKAIRRQPAPPHEERLAVDELAPPVEADRLPDPIIDLAAVDGWRKPITYDDDGRIEDGHHRAVAWRDIADRWRSES